MDKEPALVSCGNYHTIVATAKGKAYAWGNNDYGQCGIADRAQDPLSSEMIVYSPKLINPDSFNRQQIVDIECGAYFSMFIDTARKLFSCGKNTHGQLGLGTFLNAYGPVQVSKITERVSQVACGEEHSLVLTGTGQVYSMGWNQTGQLGFETPNKDIEGVETPTQVQELNFSRI